ncbi:hypothetical protein LV89_00684 [Arcicella aurantiaca]|uniref:Outer membrane protein with beta-barrel domain n=1 Tax=Arcicella aurantiaca TaxID=591202 RepID=A0A316EEI1_9BACT|nr:hypothetical protein [Arcicella aurantiaca]PWK28480.1 hypothetical protein LV89_00684 [Arcicella aurantiaca]
MQNLRKPFIIRLAYLTMAIVCTNYVSILAQDEQKAFKEGDKTLSVGVGGGMGSLGYSQVTPSISFDYGLPGTRGIVSLGGFFSYSQVKNPYGSSYPSYNNTDSLYTIYKNVGDQRKQTITAGLRFGLHYATRKWDLYAGAMIGYQKTFVDEYSNTVEQYKGSPSTIPPFYGILPTDAKLINKGTVTQQGYNVGQMIFSPYVGTKYYVTKKVSLNLEVGQYTGNVGIGFKF